MCRRNGRQLTNNLTKQTIDNIELIHEAAKKLCEVVELYGGERAMVSWGYASEESNDCVTGITLSEELELNDLRALIFQMNGRAYNLIEFDD